MDSSWSPCSLAFGSEVLISFVVVSRVLGFGFERGLPGLCFGASLDPFITAGVGGEGPSPTSPLTIDGSQPAAVDRFGGARRNGEPLLTMFGNGLVTTVVSCLPVPLFFFVPFIFSLDSSVECHLVQSVHPGTALNLFWQSARWFRVAMSGHCGSSTE